MARSRTQRDREKPYKGPESFQVEDAELFFGRDHDAKQLTAQILSRRFTLVHAPSGAGKTSLINARCLPELERGGWFAIRILPQDNPAAAVRLATLHYLMPPPSTELQSLETAVKALMAPFEEVAPEEVFARFPDLTLEELLAGFDELPIRNPNKRRLIQPIKIEKTPNQTLFPPDTLITPFFHRVLRSSIELTTLDTHLRALQQFSLQAEPIRITAETRVSTLRDVLRNPALTGAYKTYLQLLDSQEDGEAGLSAFFENVVTMYGRHHTRFKIVLLLDQFEEVYTRFVDLGAVERGTTDLPSYELREDFFEAFEVLYRKSTGEYGGTAQGSRTAALPIRFVISMRDEYIARLIDDVRHFIGNLDEASFHLNALRKNEARQAIEQPAIAYGYSYSDETYKEIIDKLTRENRFVEPAHLQIVCEKLWDKKGRDLADEASKSPVPGHLLQIEKDTLDALHGIEEILNSFFKDFLKRLKSKREQREALEMLVPLITAGGTRNIVEYDQLVKAPFRDQKVRNLLLSELENGRIVRTEQRLGGHFVEITHEFLIKPILEGIRTYLTDDAAYNRFRQALNELGPFEKSNFRVGTGTLLPKSTFRVLDRFRDVVAWPDWTVELMFRSALLHQDAEDTDEAVVRLWAEKFEQSYQAVSAPNMLQKMDDYKAHDRSLSLGELWLLNGQRDALGALSPEQIELILGSYLYEANDTEKEDIIFWAGRLQDAFARAGSDKATNKIPNEA